MSVVSIRDHRITLKVVYYGPATGGKTTSLQYIHRILDPNEEVKLVTLSTSGDSTLFFDFLPIDIGKIGGFEVRVQGYTVPGQTKYARTRKYVLSGADAIVFVANSDPAAVDENAESVRDLKENCRANGIDSESVPLVVQYNKRDLSAATPVDTLRDAVLFRPVPEYETIAIQGDGVFEAFREAVGRMVERVSRDAGLDGSRTAREVRGKLDAIRAEALAGPARNDSRRICPVSFPEDPPEGNGDTEDLLEKAIASGVHLSRLYAEVNVAQRRLEVAMRTATGLNRFARRLLGAGSTDDVWVELLRACREEVPAQGSSLLVRQGEGGDFVPVETEGFSTDPFLAALGSDTAPFLVHLGEAAHLSEKDTPDLVARMRAIEPSISGTLLVPVQVRGDVEGAVVLYRDGKSPPFHLRETKFLSSVANLASLALGRALREREFILLNRELEDRVRDRTSRLTSALRTIRKLNASLESRVKVRTSELERANETLKQTQEFLLQAEKMSSLARMAAGIAHEINNPMAFVQGNLKVLSSYARELEQTFGRMEKVLGKGQSDDVFSAMKVVLADPGLKEIRGDLMSLVSETAEGAVRVVKIADAMRNLAYLKSSEKVEVDLVAQIESALAVLEHRTKMGVEVVREFGTLPRLMGHPVLLSQLFLNVIVNALDAMQDRGRLTIRTRAERSAVIVEIEDTGPGIPEDVRAHIFEPFFTTKEVGRGTGLGLYTVYQIVERHGGMVSIDSEVGKGTTVRIHLIPADEMAMENAAPVGAGRRT